MSKKEEILAKIKILNSEIEAAAANGEDITEVTKALEDTYETCASNAAVQISPTITEDKTKEPANSEIEDEDESAEELSFVSYQISEGYDGDWSINGKPDTYKYDDTILYHEEPNKCTFIFNIKDTTMGPGYENPRSFRQMLADNIKNLGYASDVDVEAYFDSNGLPWICDETFARSGFVAYESGATATDMNDLNIDNDFELRVALSPEAAAKYKKRACVLPDFTHRRIARAGNPVIGRYTKKDAGFQYGFVFTFKEIMELMADPNSTVCVVGSYDTGADRSWQEFGYISPDGDYIMLPSVEMSEAAVTK